MMRWIVGASLKARGLVLVLGAVTMVFGITQLRDTKVDVLPEFGPPIVEVQTEALGLSAPEVEQLITVPLEQDLLDGVAWLAAIHSQSLPGLSSIEMVFEPGTDLLRARQVVQERISQAAGLPNVSSLPQMLQPESSTSRVMIVGLSSHTVSPIEMSVLARWTIRPRLLGVQGVANVAIWGQRERQLQVQVDPERLLRAGISLQQVIETTGNALWASPLTFLEANTPGTGGFIDTTNQRLAIQHLQPITTANDLARVPIEDAKGSTFRLSDVATVVEDHQPLIGDAVLPGDPGLLMVIEKSPGANTLDVTHGVEAALAALRPGLTGIDVDPTIYRPATYVEASTNDVGVALLIGFVLLLLALGAFLFDWRSAVISLAALLLSLAAALAVLQLRGVTINSVVVAGLVMALGVVIDDAIVDVEATARRLRNQLMNGRAAGASPARIILAVAPGVRIAAMYATLAIAVLVVPFFFLRGESGSFFPPLILSFLLGMAASMLVALVVTPALTLLVLSKAPPKGHGSPVATRLQGAYGGALRRALGARHVVYIAGAAVLVAGLVAVPFLSPAVLPPFKDTDLLVHLNAVPGTSLTEMDRITGRIGDEVRGIPGVANVAAHVGRAVTSDQVVGVDSAELWVRMASPAEHEATLDSIRRVVEGYPGIRGQVLTYPNEKVRSVFSESTHPIVVRVFGEDLAILHGKAQEIRDSISRIDGVVDPRVQVQAAEPTIEVEVDLAAAKGYGIKPGDVRRAAATMFSGISVGSLFDQQKVFDVVVWGAPSTRTSLSSIGNLLIDTPGGGHVRLGDVADVRITSTPSIIHHQEISRSLDITADVAGRGVGAVTSDIERELQGIQFPLEYHAEMVGDHSERQADRQRLLAVTIAAAIGILLLLQAALRSWRLATVVFIAMPVALAGGLLTALIGGRVVSLGAAAGFIAVLAIALRGAVSSIRHSRQLEHEEGIALGDELAVRASRERFIPIVMTAFCTALVILPLAVRGDLAGLELLHPMALVVLGGLVTATLFNLFVVPVLYVRFGSRPEPDIFEPETPERVITVSEAELVRGGSDLAVEGADGSS